MRNRPVTLRRELLLSFAVLFTVAMLLAVFGIVALLPYLATPRAATLFLACLVAGDLAVLFGFGSYALRQKLVLPVESMVDDVRRMTEGGSHRVRPMPSAELQAIQASVNALADRLMRDQALLALNVESLERTNAELVEARDQVVRAARLASVGTLAAGIAHEVGNPLAAVLGYADVARARALKQGLDPALLDGIRDEASRIDRIVRSLLDYARPRTREVSPVVPQDVLERVKDLLLAQGKLDRVQHEWRMEERLPRGLVEKSQLEQGIVNLLLNAVDAVEGRRDARIEVSVSSELGTASLLAPRRENDPQGVNYRHRRRTLAELEHGLVDPVFTAERVVVIRIADNGSGIRAEDLERIFDPFFTTKPPGKGTGLGLSICARLVESMGGRIDVESAGEGAVFTVRIPGASDDTERIEPSSVGGS